MGDRHFFVVDPARPLYRTAVYYVAIMTVNAFVTVLNSAVLLLILYSMIGESLSSLPQTYPITQISPLIGALLSVVPKWPLKSGQAASSMVGLAIVQSDTILLQSRCSRHCWD